jgi:hypothetical protein
VRRKMIAVAIAVGNIASFSLPRSERATGGHLIVIAGLNPAIHAEIQHKNIGRLHRSFRGSSAWTTGIGE